jgi:hypothetical protein
MSGGTWRNPVALRRCKEKRPYRSLSEAEVFASRASARSGALIIAYECPDCGRFHIGHADRAQLIVRGERCAPSCKQCCEPIPLEKRETAALNGSDILYCSDACKRKARKKRRSARFNDFPQWTAPDIE